MPEWNIEFEDKSKPEDIRHLIQRLQEYNSAHSPTAFVNKEVRLLLRDEAGEIKAGLLGLVTMHCLVIQILWVEDALRSQGIGRELVLRAETMAREHGARQVIVETTLFQAPGFYDKLGYRTICEIPDCPLDSRSLLMQKQL